MGRLGLRVAARLRKPGYWLVAQAAFAFMGLLRLMPADTAMRTADRLARRIGPISSRHRVAIENLRHAYPEKSSAEIEAIARDMWGNMARLAAEYIFLDRLFDLDPERPGAGRIEVGAEDIERFKMLAQEPGAHILFTGHLGNFELLPVAGETFGLRFTALFRPPNNPYIASYIMRRRKASMGALQPSRRGAALALARILDDGGNIGVLVDQKFRGGIPTTFFGRACETNPLLGKLARQYDCPVYPARCIRLPRNRFRLEISEALDLPREADGKVDVAATAQLLNDIVEEWVREYPGQWMWFHRRWQTGR